MGTKFIAWLDLEGRYMRTNPGYHDDMRPPDDTDEALLKRVWDGILASPKHGLPADHPFHIIDRDVESVRLEECCGLYFRYGAIMRPNRAGRVDRVTGEVLLERSALDGAWEMDADGLPVVNMPKARGVHMDWIRRARNLELIKVSGSTDRQPPEIERLWTPQRAARLKYLRETPQTFDLTTPNDTPIELRAMWPAELPSEVDHG
jgi:hypothetical protein